MRIFRAVISCMIVLFLGSSISFALTPKSEKGVKVLESDALEYMSPEWFTPMPLETAPDDIEYWLNILPYEDDKAEDMYIVFPTLGLISPVVFVPEDSNDFLAMSKGNEIDINKYLVEGVMHYPMTAEPGDEGNSVIFGHSNFFKHEPGKYKSIFADIMNLDVSVRDEMRIYVRDGSPEGYELRKFTIEESYETIPTDVGILKPKGGKELTVFACTNGLEGRRILRGKLIENDEILLTYPMKFRISESLQRLKGVESQRKQEIVSILIGRIDQIRTSLLQIKTPTYHEKYKKYILNYIEKKILQSL